MLQHKHETAPQNTKDESVTFKRTSFHVHRKLYGNTEPQRRQNVRASGLLRLLIVQLALGLGIPVRPRNV